MQSASTNVLELSRGRLDSGPAQKCLTLDMALGVGFFRVFGESTERLASESRTIAGVGVAGSGRFAR
jgi:hypothetical protein